MNKKTLSLFSIFFVISVISFGITRLFVPDTAKNSDIDSNNVNIVTSFYPIYVIALNVTQDCDVNITNLTPNQTGCLHDYQFTTSDMKNLESADAFIINGGGMEGFLHDVTNTFPNLDIIDSCKDIELIQDCEYSDPHDSHNITEESHDKSDNKLQNETHDEFEHDTDDDYSHEGHNHAHNSHVWMNTHKYIEQILNVADGLSEIDPANSDKYHANANKYIAKITDIQNELSAISIDNSNGVIIFHEAFEYLANEIGLTVNASIEIDNENTSLSSGEIAHIVDEMKEKNIQYIFTEKQFSTGICDNLAKETGAKVFVFDSLVTGDGTKDSYINGMKENIKILKQF